MFCSLHLLNEENFAVVLTSFFPQTIFNQGRPIELESVSPLCLIKSVMGAGFRDGKGRIEACAVKNGK